MLSYSRSAGQFPAITCRYAVRAPFLYPSANSSSMSRLPYPILRCPVSTAISKHPRYPRSSTPRPQATMRSAPLTYAKKSLSRNETKDSAQLFYDICTIDPRAPGQGIEPRITHMGILIDVPLRDTSVSKDSTRTTAHPADHTPAPPIRFPIPETCSPK